MIVNEKTTSTRLSILKMIREIQLKDKEQWEKLYKGYELKWKVYQVGKPREVTLAIEEKRKIKIKRGSTWNFQSV